MYTPFLGGQSARSKIANAGRRVNFYPEMDDSGKSVAVLYGTPGLLLKLTLTIGPTRGFWVVKDFLYAVSGNKLYRIDTSWTATELGTLNSSSGRVGISDNGIQVLIVDGTYGYICTIATGVFSQVTDPDFPAARTCAFQDGYFILDVSGTGQFMITGLYNGGDVDALDLASAEGSPDDVVAVLSDHREAWIFGDKTTEVYWNSGNSDFPFQRIEGAFIEHGCAAPYSPAKMDNTVFWLGQDDKGHGIVWRAAGYTPTRISNHKVEFAIQSYGDISDAFGYCYQQEGHSFYVLTFPTADKTWCFDAATNEWHERSYFSNGSHGRHRSNCYAFFNQTHVVGDFENGNVYALDMDTYSDNEAPIVGLLVDRHHNADMHRILHRSLQIDFEAGVGLVTGQGSDPQAMLRWSNDGGKTFGNVHSRSMGAIGAYTCRAKWDRMGVARDRVYELSISDPVKRVIVGANLDAIKL